MSNLESIGHFLNRVFDICGLHDYELRREAVQGIGDWEVRARRGDVVLATRETPQRYRVWALLCLGDSLPEWLRKRPLPCGDCNEKGYLNRGLGAACTTCHGQGRINELVLYWRRSEAEEAYRRAMRQVEETAAELSEIS